MCPSDPLAALRQYAAAVEAILQREGTLMVELVELALSDPAIRRAEANSDANDIDEFATFLSDVQLLGKISSGFDPVGVPPHAGACSEGPLTPLSGPSFLSDKRSAGLHSPGISASGNKTSLTIGANSPLRSNGAPSRQSAEGVTWLALVSFVRDVR